MRLVRLAAMLVLPYLASCGGGVVESFSGVGGAASSIDLAAGAREPLVAANAAIERAKDALTRTHRPGSADDLKSLEDAQRAIREVIVAQQQVRQELDLVRKLGNELQAGNAVLQREKAALQRDKSDLERRELIWSTGFLAALLTALVALVTVVFRWPLLRLDMQLKRIEIKEREFALRKQIGSAESGN